MDPMSFLLDDPYHLTHDVYEFEPLELPFDFPNQDHAQPAAEQIIHDGIILNDEGRNIMNGEGLAGNEGRRRNGNRKRKKEEMSKGKVEVHREAERQRRQDMASLHRSLRTLLPPEYVKGKRSMSDHLHEAVNYIRHLKVKNQALREKRERLKKAEDEESPGEAAGVGCLAQCADRVVVKACRDGVEVLVGVKGEEGSSCGNGNGNGNGNGMAVSTSRVLKALLHQGLDVTSCLSTHTDNDKWLHCVQAQVGEGCNIYPELQQKLMKNLSA